MTMVVYLTPAFIALFETDALAISMPSMAVTARLV